MVGESKIGGKPHEIIDQPRWRRPTSFPIPGLGETQGDVGVRGVVRLEAETHEVVEEGRVVVELLAVITAELELGRELAPLDQRFFLFTEVVVVESAVVVDEKDVDPSRLEAQDEVGGKQRECRSRKALRVELVDALFGELQPEVAQLLVAEIVDEQAIFEREEKIVRPFAGLS